MERPDLDAIEQRLSDWEPYLEKDQHWSSASIALLLSDQAKAIAYCRELEAESRRQKDQIAGLSAALTDAEEALADQAAM